MAGSTGLRMPGIHHITAICADPQRNVDFYVGLLGLRLVKKTVSFDDPGSYHLLRRRPRFSGDHPDLFAWILPPTATARARQWIGQITARSITRPTGVRGMTSQRREISSWLIRAHRVEALSSAIMSAPSVSVIIPTYNSLGYLRAAIGSVLDQTFADLECIVVDDGSPDATAAYVRMHPDSRLRLVRTRHSGSPAIARNTGIREAGGEWIAFLDHDDLWEPDKLAEQFHALKECPDAVWAYAGRTQIDALGRRIADFDASYPFSGARLMSLLGVEPGIATSTVLMRRSALDAVGHFDEALAFAEEVDLFVRLRALSEPVVVRRPLARVRRYDGNHSTHHPIAVTRSWLQLFAKVARTSPLLEVRRECRRLRVHHGITVVNQLTAAGYHREAASHLARLLIRHPLSARLWSGIGNRLRRTFAGVGPPTRF